jgi:hypothetical protein
MCDGKMMRMKDKNCEGNYSILKDKWKSGKNVIVYDVKKNMEMRLWNKD